MRSRHVLVLAALLALACIPGDDVFGQRGGGRGGGAAVHGARGGAVVGPYGGHGAGYRSGGTVVGPAGGSRTAGRTSGSYTTGRGTTVDYAGAGRGATGPGGVSAGRGVGGVQVTTPGGQTATRVGSVGGVQGPGGRGAVGGRSVGGTSGPYGAGVSASRGGAAYGPGGAVAGGSRVGAGVGPGGAVAGGTRVGGAMGPGGAFAGGTRVGGAVGPGGAVAGASHWGAAANPYGGYRSAARGVAVGGAVGHYTAYRSAATLRTTGGYVRAGFTGYGRYFNAGWYTAHPGAWRVAAWTPAYYWRWAPYATIATFCSYPATPVVYDYGTTVVYQDNSVYYNGEPVATAEQYATQATDLAAVGQAAAPPETAEWQPLGVFAMVQGDEQEANNVFQLAINKDGVLRGNYFNALTEASVPVYGSVDKRTQRAAWTVGDNKTTVYETGLGNLSEPETSMLVHCGTDRTQQWTLVRLEQSSDSK